MISNIRLQQFRSYKDASFRFDPAMNVIVGPNGSGKTNLLEAVLVVCRGFSYRVHDAELVAFNASWARLDAHYGDSQRTVKIVAEPPVTKSYELDGKSYKRLTLPHSLPVVLFEPNHLSLVHGSPEQRRLYLDDLLQQTTPDHAPLLRNYKRVLAQRNALLKRGKKPTNEELFPWNLRLSELGALLSRRRAELVDRIDAVLTGEYHSLAKAEADPRIHYQPQFGLESYETDLLRKLEHGLNVDVLRGFTGSGPHREDFLITLNGHPADETASRGEIRSLVLALKIIELDLLAASRDAAPLLLLDDVFSELDTIRRHALTEKLHSYQTFITTTDADVATKNLAGRGNTIRLA